jgi:choline dehydrogenase-like flavoprotein
MAARPGGGVAARQAASRRGGRGLRFTGADDGSACARALEQAPDPDNRIRLAPQRDRFRRSAVELTFRISDEDRRRHGRGLRIAAEEIGLDGRHIENELHRIVRDRQVHYSWHHMGTTRMHADPQRGVVDGEPGSHGVQPFIAGSSVFPTGGVAPPTLTIVAMSLRLGEHIARHFA